MLIRLQTKMYKGFTLVELSIVIVIISMIVAGVTSGGSLLKLAKLRRIMSDVESFRVATNAFIAKYDALPGDITDATAYWAATVNGNGDRRISWTDEGYRAWQHLSLAKLVPGSYTGTSTGNTGVPGVNAPAGPIPNSCYTFIHETTSNVYVSGIGFFNYINYGNIANANPCATPLLLPSDAYAIDKKMDDGIHSTGQVRIRLDSGGNSCANGANYDLTRTSKSCAMAFLLKGF